MKTSTFNTVEISCAIDRYLYGKISAIICSYYTMHGCTHLPILSKATGTSITNNRGRLRISHHHHIVPITYNNIIETVKKLPKYKINMAFEASLIIIPMRFLTDAVAVNCL